MSKTLQRLIPERLRTLIKIRSHRHMPDLIHQLIRDSHHQRHHRRRRRTILNRLRHRINQHIREKILINPSSGLPRIRIKHVPRLGLLPQFLLHRRWNNQQARASKTRINNRGHHLRQLDKFTKNRQRRLHQRPGTARILRIRLPYPDSNNILLRPSDLPFSSLYRHRSRDVIKLDLILRQGMPPDIRQNSIPSTIRDPNEKELARDRQIDKRFPDHLREP